jgi:hypothetical protein
MIDASLDFNGFEGHAHDEDERLARRPSAAAAGPSP